MAQFGRPEADTLRDNWVTNADGTTNLYQTIDESTASDADFIKTQAAPSSDVFVTRLSDMEDPVSSSGHIVRYRYSKDAASGAQIDLTVQLRQGYTNESSLGTLIAAETVTNISNSWVDGDFTLSGAEADAITDYTNLYLRFVANQV